MLKKIAIAVVLIVVVVIAGLYIYRHAIIRYYTEKIIRENLPGYIKIDKIDFDFTDNKVSFKNFRILNAPGFSSQYFLKISDISCKYSIMGKGIPTGLEIRDVLLSGADLRIERSRDSIVNAARMENFIQSFSPPSSLRVPPQQDEAIYKNEIASVPRKDSVKSIPDSKDLSGLIKLPVSFNIKNAKLVFLDKVPYDNPYIIAIESVNGQVLMNFKDNYSGITSLSFTLSGCLNGDKEETIQWLASLDPNKPKLTMSNRFEVSGLDLPTFEPYYDSFSPLIFRRGRVSGTLVFDFNDGNIGSKNEIYLSNLAFSVKKGYENAQMWGTTVPEIMRYFTTTSGDIVFDFKLKGDMTKPEFYLGPISKRALTSMVINKVAAYAIDQAAKQSGVNDMGKAKEAIDMFRQLLKKQ